METYWAIQILYKAAMQHKTEQFTIFPWVLPSIMKLRLSVQDVLSHIYVAYWKSTFVKMTNFLQKCCRTKRKTIDNDVCCELIIPFENENQDRKVRTISIICHMSHWNLLLSLLFAVVLFQNLFGFVVLSWHFRNNIHRLQEKT